MSALTGFDSVSCGQQMAELETRHLHTELALRSARAKLEGMQSDARIDELELRRCLGKVQWLQGRRADLQETMDRLAEGAST